VVFCRNFGTTAPQPRETSVFNHIMVGANDLEASKKFYDATLGALGHSPGTPDDKGRIWWKTSSGVLAIIKPLDGQPASCANGGTIGFKAATAEQLHAWHDAGVATGGTTCEDPPGPRAGGQMSLAYLRDPAGNKLCAVYQPS
jgi:catechol 2,3-dioxygenase-like lactoylglutathione lyase family enzyme